MSASGGDRAGIVVIVLFLTASALFAVQTDEERPRGDRSTSARCPYNRGYLYYNPGAVKSEMLPEAGIPAQEYQEPAPQETAPRPEKGLLEEREIERVLRQPEEIQPEPARPLARPEEPLYQEEETPVLPETEEQGPAPSGDEVVVLRKKLADTLRELAFVRQEMRELRERKSLSKTTETYLVKKGDCLWAIAKKTEVYSDPYKWLLLYHANRDQIFDPNVIFPNMVLVVPRLEEYEKKAR